MSTLDTDLFVDPKTHQLYYKKVSQECPKLTDSQHIEVCTRYQNSKEITETATPCHNAPENSYLDH